MKRILILLLTALLLCGCTAEPPVEETTVPTETEAEIPTEPATESTTEPAPAKTVTPTELHHPLWIDIAGNILILAVAVTLLVLAIVNLKKK